RAARLHQELPHADPRPAGRHAVASAADLDRRRFARAELRDHGLPVAGTRGIAAAHHPEGANLSEVAPPAACRRAVTHRPRRAGEARREPGVTRRNAPEEWRVALRFTRPTQWSRKRLIPITRRRRSGPGTYPTTRWAASPISTVPPPARSRRRNCPSASTRYS